MPVETNTFIFGRLNLVAHYDDKAAFLSNLLCSAVTVHTRGFDWEILNVEPLLQDGYAFIYGCLAKFVPNLPAEAVDRPRARSSPTTYRDHIVAKSPFMLHVKTGLIAFHPVPNHISNSTFRSMFAKLVERGQGDLMIGADVQIVDEEHQILTALKKFTIINKLSITLHPSNLSSRDIWKRTDERLRAMRAEKLKQEYTSQQGLHITEGDDAYAGIVMASDGYGKATVRGTIDGRETTVSTERLPVTSEAVADEDPSKLLEKLSGTFRDIWERMKKP